jgi:hypothetical protein
MPIVCRVTLRQAMPRRRFLLLLAFALVALAVRYLVIGLPSSSAGLPRLAGKTTQGANFHLTLGDDGRVLAVRTRITGSCTHDQTWSTGWLAVEGHGLHFSRVGRNFVTRGYWEWRYASAGIAHLALTLRGTFTGQGSAQGTVRLVTRFYNGPTQSYACDSRDVAWAVGHDAPERLRHVTLGRVVGYYYPSVPSLARPLDAKRQRFIERADAICARLIAQAPGPDDRRVFRRLSKALRGLGEPPDGRHDYARWLAEVRQGAAYNGPDGYVWKDANWYAQLFGLRRCSSYGNGTPVPILSDGQPRPLT